VAGAKPFTIKALTEVFARTQSADFLANQQEVLRALWSYCPGEFRSALWVMDSVHFQVPAGAHTPAESFKACVLGVWQDSVVWPLLWAFDAPLSGCLIRDIYPHKIKYHGLVTTARHVPASDILADDRCRWTLEEVYMTLTRYWQFDDLAPCRVGLAYALVHFAFLAFTLLGFYLQETDAALDLKTWNSAPPPLPLPERELAIYAGPHFTLLLPSQLVTLILANVDAWQANRDQLILALRLCEGHT